MSIRDVVRDQMCPEHAQFRMEQGGIVRSLKNPDLFFRMTKDGRIQVENRALNWKEFKGRLEHFGPFCLE